MMFYEEGEITRDKEQTNCIFYKSTNLIELDLLARCTKFVTYLSLKMETCCKSEGQI